VSPVGRPRLGLAGRFPTVCFAFFKRKFLIDFLTAFKVPYDASKHSEIPVRMEFNKDSDVAEFIEHLKRHDGKFRVDEVYEADDEKLVAVKTPKTRAASLKTSDDDDDVVTTSSARLRRAKSTPRKSKQDPVCIELDAYNKFSFFRSNFMNVNFLFFPEPLLKTTRGNHTKMTLQGAGPRGRDQAQSRWTTTITPTNCSLFILFTEFGQFPSRETTNDVWTKVSFSTTASSTFISSKQAVPFLYSSTSDYE